MIGILFSIGAINALIPIIVILVLVAAAAGSSRGSKLFEMFGIGALMGINVGRGTLSRKSPFKTKRFTGGSRNPFQRAVAGVHGAAKAKVLPQLAKSKAINASATELVSRLGTPPIIPAATSTSSSAGLTKMAVNPNATPASAISTKRTLTEHLIESPLHQTNVIQKYSSNKVGQRLVDLDKNILDKFNPQFNAATDSAAKAQVAKTAANEYKKEANKLLSEIEKVNKKSIPSSGVYAASYTMNTFKVTKKAKELMGNSMEADEEVKKLNKKYNLKNFDPESFKKQQAQLNSKKYLDKATEAKEAREKYEQFKEANKNYSDVLSSLEKKVKYDQSVKGSNIDLTPKNVSEYIKSHKNK